MDVAFREQGTVLHHRLIARLLTATVIGQVLIVVTGGVVRITDSGLGCPTWPRCTDESITPTAGDGAMWIEFSNRLIALAVVGLCAASFIVLHRRRDAVLTALTTAQLGGVIGQAALGGLSVLVELDPLVVAAHLLVSVCLIYVAVAVKVRADHAQISPTDIDRASRALASVVLFVGLPMMLAGALITAAGPHAGDPGADRLALNEPVAIRVHAVAALLLMGVLVLASRSLARARRASDVRAALVVILGLLVAQLTIGTWQVTAGRPAIAVALHLLIAATLTALVAYVHCRTRTPARSIR